MNSQNPRPQLRAGMVGMGMIFDETYRPFFESVHAKGSMIVASEISMSQWSP